MLSNYQTQKYGHAYIVTEHEYTCCSNLFSCLSYGWMRNHAERELLSLLNRQAGLFFHKHNIIVRWDHVQHEIDQFYLELSTALQYKNTGIEDDGIPLHDISLTICCEETPVRLLKYLDSKKYQVVSFSSSLYYIYKDGQIDTQIVLTSPMFGQELTWRNFFLPVSGFSKQRIAS